MVTVIDSPPGAGKTSLVATIAAHLGERSGMNVTIATNTRKQAAGIAHRLVEQMPANHIAVLVKSLDPEELPDGVERTNRRVGGKSDVPVEVRTVASCRMRVPPKCDVLIIDEAYQITISDIIIAANSATQVLLVGDPGQIGPVITCNTTAWCHHKLAPHQPSPEVLRQHEDATVFNLPVSWRLGPKTVAAIRPLYRFDFTSARPDRSVEEHDEIEQITVPPNNDPADGAVMRTVVDRAVSFIGKTLTEDVDGSEQSREITGQDIAVVLSHNSQCSLVGAMLHSDGHDDVTVGTADRLQGGEWSVVIAVDPLIGHVEASPHSLSLGRLCVMASRHSTHLSWVHDGHWRELCEDDSPADSTVPKSISVREALCGMA